MRLSASSFAGTARTLVAVGTCNEASMLETIFAATPRIGVVCALPSGDGGAVGAGGLTAAGFAGAVDAGAGEAGAVAAGAGDAGAVGAGAGTAAGAGEAGAADSVGGAA